jgi:hypothetical protein
MQFNDRTSAVTSSKARSVNEALPPHPRIVLITDHGSLEGPDR